MRWEDDPVPREEAKEAGCVWGGGGGGGGGNQTS